MDKKDSLEQQMLRECKGKDVYSQCRWLGEYVKSNYDVNTLAAIPDGIKNINEADKAFLLSMYDRLEGEFTKIAAMVKLGGEVKSTSLVPKELDLVFVKGGTFRMGSTDSDASDSEKPVHSVTLSDFYIGKYPVTQKIWNMVMPTNDSDWKGDNLPVEEVSWFDCVRFCNQLSDYYGRQRCYRIDNDSVSILNGGKGGFRLATEAEWEYAARGGQLSGGFKYAGSNDVDEVAWHDKSSGGKTHNVGEKKPNELGLYDMNGNVYEWCWDYWNDSYPSSAQSNLLVLLQALAACSVGAAGSSMPGTAECRTVATARPTTVTATSACV